MRKIILFIALSVYGYSYSQIFPYQRSWATYYGDDSLRIIDNDIDSQGNVYLVGFVNKQDYTDSNFIASVGANQTEYGGGKSDGFIAKFSAGGLLIWSSYFGGENTDYFTGMCIDGNDNIYIVGRTNSASNIATPQAYQDNLIGVDNVFITRMTSNGSVIWSTYYGGLSSNEIQYTDNQNLLAQGRGDIVTDNLGGLYFYCYTRTEGMATSGAFQTTFNALTKQLLSKFTVDGQRVWATYYGINRSSLSSISINESGIFVAGSTIDCMPFGTFNTYFATAGAHQPIPGGCNDLYISKFDFSGDRIWSTYYGNSTSESVGGHALSATNEGIFLAASIFTGNGNNNLTTVGSFQEGTSSNISTNILVKFSNNGVRQWATLYGDRENTGNNNEGLSLPTVSADLAGNVFLGGYTRYLSNLTSSGSYQEENAGLFDNFTAKFNPQGKRLWGTFYGGTNYEFPPLKTLTYGNDFYIMGMTNSTEGISTPGSYQPDYATNVFQPTYLPSNIFIAKFGQSLGTQQFSKDNLVLFPNPAVSSFTVRDSKASNDSFEFMIYDVTGRVLKNGDANFNQQINIEGLSSGNYIVKIDQGTATASLKLIKK